MRVSRTSSDREPYGTAVLKPSSSPSAPMSREKYSETCADDHGVMAPSSIDLEWSGTTRSGSTSMRVPRPWHSGQAPNGALNENDRGSSSSTASGWSLGQASFSENRRRRCGSSSGRSTKSARTRPSARLSAVSTDSVSRCFIDGLDLEPVDDHVDGVLLLLGELGRLVGEVVHGAVDQRAAEALRLQLAEQLAVLPLAATDDRREHLEARVGRQRQDAVDDLLRRLAWRSARRTRGSAVGRRARRAGAGSRRPR